MPDPCVTLDDFEQAARRRVPRVIFDMIAGGAGNETTLRANRVRLDGYVLLPRILADVSERALSVSVLGTEISMPVMLAPTGAGRVLHRYAELEVAKAAGEAGVVYMQSTISSYSLEAVAKAASGPLWYQLYVPTDRTALEATIDRVRSAGYRALAVTVDTPVFGYRDRDARNRADEFKVRLRYLPEAVLRPRWTWEFLRGNVGNGPLRQSMQAHRDGRGDRLAMSETRSTMMGASYAVTWSDLALIRSLWRGPLLVKGVLRATECRRLLDYGVDGIVVSNHGGRQLDGAPATIDALGPVVDAIAEKAEVFVDGGIRRGSDVVKMLALGARACFIGRPYLYGLAVDGQLGVTSVLDLLRKETDRALGLVGCSSATEVDRSYVAAMPWAGSMSEEGARRR